MAIRREPGPEKLLANFKAGKLGVREIMFDSFLQQNQINMV
jgi:hypothetical protein